MRIKLKLAGMSALVVVTALTVIAVGATAASGSEFAPPPFPVAFKGSGGVAKLESAAGSKITCEKSTSTGAVTGKFLAMFTVEYTGKCEIKSALINGACTEPIVTDELTAEPGVIVGGTERGLLIKAASGAVLAEPKCAGITIKVEGSVVCESKGAWVKKLALSGEVACEQAKPGEQKLMKIEVQGVAHEDDLLVATAPFTNEKVALTATLLLDFAREIEQT